MAIPRRFQSSTMVRGGKAKPGPGASLVSGEGGGGGVAEYWEPLTDGDETDPELIYAAGDVIMVAVPIKD